MTNSVCSLCLGTGKVFHENPPRKDTPYSRCHCQVVAVSQPDEVRSVDALGTEIAKLMDVHGIKPPLPPKFWLALEKLLSGGVAQASRNDIGILLSALRQFEEAVGETFDDEGGDIAAIERDYKASPVPSAQSKSPCVHNVIIGLDGAWHCQTCGDGVDMAVAHSSTGRETP